MREDIKLLYIDLFCGAGGTSTGVENAILNGRKCAKVIACVNHDKNAIASHSANHPDALHFVEDIRTLEMSKIIPHVSLKREEYPGAMVVLWASLECTNFSKAKGGLPRNADSRTLAEHLFRYIEAIQPDYIQIENVEEFMSWGDLDENGHPIEKLKGSSYIQWVEKVKSYGYEFDYRILNSADYGAITSRKRFFGQFAKTGMPIVFPVQTHSKNGRNGYEHWRAVKSAIDFSDEGKSIFTRKKPLVEKTLERIYAGLVKFVGNSVDDDHVHFLSKQFSGHPQSKNVPISEPAGAITCRDHHAFVTAYYGNGFNASVEQPIGTITTKDRYAKIDVNFIANQYGNGGGQLSDVQAPAPTIMTNPKQNLVTVKKHYLMNPQYNCKGHSIDNPCFTLIARMDKAAPYLISAESGQQVQILDGDSPMTVKIKEFMIANGIIDIKMRMLKISELKQIMGFPKDYVLVGTVAEQKKYIGNAVEVNMSRVMCEALCENIETNYHRKAV